MPITIPVSRMARSSWGATRPLRDGWFTTTMGSRVVVFNQRNAATASASFVGELEPEPCSRESWERSKARSRAVESALGAKNTVACSAPGTLHSMPCHSRIPGCFRRALRTSTLVGSTEDCSCAAYPWSVMTSQDTSFRRALVTTLSTVYTASYEYCVWVW
jgi:hypothetical protein